MLDDKISADEIRGMLMLSKAELERSLRAEATRLRHIESRLQQIDEQGALADYDVVVEVGAGAALSGAARDLPGHGRRRRDAARCRAHRDGARACARRASTSSSSPIPTSTTRISISRSASA